MPLWIDGRPDTTWGHGFMGPWRLYCGQWFRARRVPWIDPLDVYVYEVRAWGFDAAGDKWGYRQDVHPEVVAQGGPVLALTMDNMAGRVTRRLVAHGVPAGEIMWECTPHLEPPVRFTERAQARR